METVKTIKNVDDKTWAQFKSIAAQNNAKAGQMFELLVDEYQKHAKGWWERVLSRKPVLSKEECDELEASMKKMRKEYGWRI